MKYKYRYTRADVNLKLMDAAKNYIADIEIDNVELAHVVAINPRRMMIHMIDEHGVEHMMLKVWGLSDEHEYVYDYATHEYVMECEL